MQGQSLSVLCATAVFLGFFHTIVAPDHYLPFAAMARANGWGDKKALWVTFLCACGHMLSAFLLGAVVIVAGISLGKLELFEEMRGGISTVLLIGLGIIYMVWGIKRARSGHVHCHGLPHDISHDIIQSNETDSDNKSTHNNDTVTPWALFIILAVGPCEILIPILIAPAASLGVLSAVLVGTLFMATTVVTMLAATYLALKGLSLIKSDKLERYSFVIAGAAVTMTGVVVMAMGH